MFSARILVTRIKQPLPIARTIRRSLTTPTKDAESENIETQKHNQKKKRKVPEQPSAEYLKKANELEKGFCDRLKQVFVTSKNENASLDLPEELMPKDRESTTVIEPHSQQVEVRTKHKLLIEEVNTILFNYKSNPETWTPAYISEQYDVPIEKIVLLLDNYGSLNTFMASRPIETDKNIPRPEYDENKIQHDHTFWDAEDLMVAKGEKKWMSPEKMNRFYNADKIAKKLIEEDLKKKAKPKSN